MKKTKIYYRKVVRIGGGRDLAIGSFTPVNWISVKAKVVIKKGSIPLKIVIELESV